MREIKFRAKRADNGAWVYGDLTHVQNILSVEEVQRSGRRSEPAVRVANYDVDEETTGQYTGLKDRDGNEIYEGDILCFMDTKGVTYLFEVVYEDGAFCFSHYRERAFTELRHHNLRKYIVNGNIYDSPELLTE